MRDNAGAALRFVMYNSFLLNEKGREGIEVTDVVRLVVSYRVSILTFIDKDFISFHFHFNLLRREVLNLVADFRGALPIKTYNEMR